MTMTKVDGANLVVVDGSNIATEGRSIPSLSQLNDAVLAFTEEHPDVTVTVVVDATFGHRIDKSEVADFDEAVAHNELVAPPAGAVGRGDAFVLSIANKVGARILSNDSFQEFHGKYPWLFDEGRLIGGKPVPFVGWVFVDRLPVKGPVSRRARSSGGGGSSSVNRRTVSKMASLPMPVPTAPPPGAVVPGRRGDVAPADAPIVDNDAPAPADAPRSSRGRRRSSFAPPQSPQAPSTAPAAPRQQGVDASTQKVNELMPFLEFVEIHPVGTAVDGVVDSYSSHGAYVTIGDVRGYVPLRLLADPPPRSAREVLKLGDTVRLEVVSFAPTRCSIDLRPATVVAEDAPAAEPATPTPATEKRRGRGRSSRAAEAAVAPADVAVATDAGAPSDTVEPSRRSKRAAKAVAVEAVTAPPPETAPAAEPAPARPRRRAASVAAEPATPEPTQQPAKKTASSRTRAADASAPEAPAKKSAAEKAPPKTAPARTAPAKTAPAKKSAAKKAPAKKTSATSDAPPPEAPAAPKSSSPAAKKAAPAAKKSSTTAAKKSSTTAAKKAPATAKKAPAATKRAASTGGGASAQIPGRGIERARSILLVEIGNGVGGSA